MRETKYHNNIIKSTVQKLPAFCPFLRFYTYSSTAPLGPNINDFSLWTGVVRCQHLESSAGRNMMLKLMSSCPRVRKKLWVIFMFGNMLFTMIFLLWSATPRSIQTYYTCDVSTYIKHYIFVLFVP